MTRGVEEMEGGGWRRREALVENPSERGAQWPRFQWRERERGREKIFEERWRGDSIRFRGKKKEKRKTRDDTSPRKSIFSK